MAINFNNHLPALKESFQSGKMTFYLGAGVSKPNGLPSWEELVQALYFSTLEDETYIYELRPYPNYLFALAEWVLKQKNEPLDIIIRKIKQWYEGKDFISMMKNTLYAGLGREQYGSQLNGLPQELIYQNSTLRAIVDCCHKSRPGKKGLKSIITYNYDNLLELGLENHSGLSNQFQPVYKQRQSLETGKIPIYHVHGYIPYEDEDDNVDYDEVIFSEEQYNRAFQDPFFWGNVVQVNQLTSSTGLMIGLSLSDRNTRRILDSIRHQPVPNDNYIMMKKPRFDVINNDEIDHINEQARIYMERFPTARMKQEHKAPAQIQHILDRIYRYEEHEFERGFENLGLKLITFDEFDEIPEILSEISCN